MGFLPDIKKIMAHLPDKNKVPRQSMLFSATMEGQIQNVAHLSELSTFLETCVGLSLTIFPFLCILAPVRSRVKEENRTRNKLAHSRPY